MSWATQYIDRLRLGETVQFRPRGNSMQGRIESGQLVTVEPVDGPAGRQIEIGNVVLCVVGGKQWLHLVKAIADIPAGSDPAAGRVRRYQIGNNKGRVNGWCALSDIFGVVTKVEDRLF